MVDPKPKPEIEIENDGTIGGVPPEVAEELYASGIRPGHRPA